MAIPRARVFQIPNGLQLVDVPAVNVHLCIGVATDGPTLEPRLVQYTTLLSTFKGGPAVKAAAYSTGKNEAPLIFVRVPATARAASFDVRLTDWTGTSSVTPSGTPLDSAIVVIKTIAPGTVGVVGITYQVSTNGGETFGATTALGGALFIVANGVTFTFQNGQTFAGEVAILCLPASATIFGVTVTKDGSSGDIDLTGTPIDQYEPIVEILTGGEGGVEGITIRYSLDGGRTYSNEIRMGTNVTYDLIDYVGNGYTVLSGLTFEIVAASTYLAGDKIVAKTSAPEAQPSDIALALQAVDDEQQFAAGYGFAHAVGDLGTLSAHVTALQAKLDELDDEDTYTSMITASRDRGSGEPAAEWEADLAARFAAFNADRLYISAGYARITDPCGGWRLRRPVAWRAVERLVSQPIPQALHDFSVGAVDDFDLADADGLIVEHDARLSSTLHDARAITARTRKRRPGTYFTGSPTMAPTNSDFSIIMYRRIMDIASAVVQLVGEDLLGSGGNPATRLTFSAQTGLISERSAQRVDRILENAVNEAVSVNGSGTAPGVSLVQVKLNRTESKFTNPPGTGPSVTLKTDIRMIPIVFVGGFEGTIQFVRRIQTTEQ